jgi:hypothetical protein
LPVVDGFLWSTADEKAGLRLTDKDGNHPAIGSPIVSELPDNVLQVEFTTASEQTFDIVFYEDRFEVVCTKGASEWALELTATSRAELPFQSIEGKQIKASLNGFEYSITCRTGTIEKTEGCIFRIKPSGNKIIVDCSKRI